MDESVWIDWINNGTYVETSGILPRFAFVFDWIRRKKQKEKSGYKQKAK
jgi:hypothetical protein